MSFRLPESSDLPSTPNTRGGRSLRSMPSTTPAGPPPSHLTNRSTTPAIPPPKSVFGSSFNAANNTFPRMQGSSLKAFTVPESSPPCSDDRDLTAEERTAMDSVEQHPTPDDLFAEYDTLMSPAASSPRGFKRSRSGRVQPRRQSNMPAIARGMTSSSNATPLREGEDFILNTEEVVRKFDAEAQTMRLSDVEEALVGAVSQLTLGWREQYPPTTKEGSIGPASGESAAKACYLASFLFELHHPHDPRLAQTLSTIRQARSKSLAKRSPSPLCPVPRALLDWINAHHNPFPDEFNTVHLYQPSPSAHDGFWDVVYSSVLRGKFDRAIRLLKDAGWENAMTALDDGASRPGYTGKQLDNTRDAVEGCISILQTCPAVRHDDWDVKSRDWSIFRQRVRQAVNEMDMFAGSEKEDSQSLRENMFVRSAQGNMSLSTAIRKAESKIPWSVYENLKLVYGQLLGSEDEIILSSQDWLEASVFLTVWWSGDDETEPSFRMSRSAMRKSTAGNQATREIEVAPLVAYRKRLADACAVVTEAPEDAVFSIDTMDPVQVGLACAMEDSVGSVFAILASLSMPVVAAVSDIAAFGGWLPEASSRTRGLLEQGFSSEDLMVLSHGPGSQPSSTGGFDRDEILSRYADLLAEKDVLRSSDGKNEKEGWELAASVLARLNDEAFATRKTSELLDRVQVTDEPRLDKVLRLCSDLGLAEQGRVLSERYADSLADSSQSYGAALVFYARAHATQKLQNTLALLTSLCLIQSAAMPPRSQMDGHLASLLSTERTDLLNLATSDPEASTLLAGSMSGYGTLRRFYDLRDQELTSSPDGMAKLKPLERRREAAKALVGAIESASDCIRGGLFDPDVESVIPVDGLLVLLGEVLPLLDQQKRIFTQKQIYALLRVIEDFAACPSRIRETAEDLLKACANACGGATGGSGSLKTSRSDVGSISGLSGSSYDLLASSSGLILNQEKGLNAVQRAWDWRKGLSGIGLADVNAKSVLMILRVALAQEVARGWSGMSNW